MTWHRGFGFAVLILPDCFLFEQEQNKILTDPRFFPKIGDLWGSVFTTILPKHHTSSSEPQTSGKDPRLFQKVGDL
ncbi:MAG: hypothetical protein C6Y22_08985 [Hapalosiphonaceae cyanobacterium JJU2]|nr:MAG: hypothetical protein C6Y22_08985 [Hapalosiphonaceae cyanobacterium JJU2]